MSLKSVRDNYSKLISAFQDAGVMLNESQKSSLDTFIVALESKIQKMKESTVKATKKVVTEHLENEYKKVFEKILEHQIVHSKLVGKIQTTIDKINESKKIARNVSNFLDLHVESILPEKTIVDYDRMNKLERLQESLKDVLLINDDDVEAKKQQLQESYDAKRKALETQIAKLQVQLNESMDKNIVLNKKLDLSNAKTLLESKLQNLPKLEANAVRRRLENATTAEVNAKFKRIVESVKADIKEDEEIEEASIEEEIEGILEKDDCDCKCKKAPKKEPEETIDEDDCDECDPTRGKMHNMHIPEAECDEDDPTKGSMHNMHIPEDEDIQLNESEKIDSNLMAYWCQKVSEIETKGY